MVKINKNASKMFAMFSHFFCIIWLCWHGLDSSMSSGFLKNIQILLSMRSYIKSRKKSGQINHSICKLWQLQFSRVPNTLTPKCCMVLICSPLLQVHFTLLQLHTCTIFVRMTIRNSSWNWNLENKKKI